MISSTFAQDTGMLKLYGLVGIDAPRRFSPCCWRMRMALADGMARKSPGYHG